MIHFRRLSGLVLYLYTVFFLMRFDLSGDIIRLLEALQEPSVFMVFCFLGLYPLAYLLYLKRSPSSRRMRVKIAVVFSFFLGAFALEWVMIKPIEEPLTSPSKMSQALARFGMVSTFLLVIFGFALGSFDGYLQAFQTIAFVHIMTLDFILLTIWSWTLKQPEGVIKAIPLIGLFKASS